MFKTEEKQEYKTNEERKREHERFREMFGFTPYIEKDVEELEPILSPESSAGFLE